MLRLFSWMFGSKNSITEQSLKAETAFVPTANGKTRLTDEQLAVVRSNRMLFEGVVYRIKKDSLSLVAELNKGREDVDCEKLARQMVFFQSQLIQASYNDPNVTAEQRQVLLNYHQINVKTALGERRGTSRRN